MINKFNIILVLLVGLTLYSLDQHRLQKLQIKDQLNHIDIITQETQELLCENEMLLAVMDSLPLGSPILDTIKISSNYGWRKRPLGLGYGFHSGLDINAVWWDTIHSSGHGIVKSAYWMGGYGRCVVIQHVGGYESTYAHLFRIFVNKGDSVKRGQPIGRAGNSGAVTGPHLHYEIRRNGESADPLEYIDMIYKILKVSDN